MDQTNRLPSVDRLSRCAGMERFSPKTRVKAARAAIARVRAGGMKDPSLRDIVSLALSIAEQCEEPAVRPAVNLSGVVLHTGLGRARLAREAAERIESVARRAATVEIDLETGGRGDRQEAVRGLLTELTGAEDALVVNNCAAAVHLVLKSLAEDEGVVLSRGQMVEIGGSFRMPDIVRDSGCRLVEVGCTNRTRLDDYRAALETGCSVVLRCHRSNFAMTGFVAEPTAKETSGLARSFGALMIDDLGSGCLVDTTRFGLPKERTLAEAVADGADVVTASGDKLLGGPQSGIILGRAELVGRIRGHPLARALRIDKLSLAGLEATLRMYAEGRESDIPVWRAMARPLSDVRRDARRLAAAFPGESETAPGTTELGGGSLPGAGVPTWRAGLHHRSPETLLAALRRSRPPVIGRIEKDRVWLDPRAADADDIRDAVAVLRSLTLTAS
jgi:L-seryl-tRNA(Ser) seleniumtransferase